MNTTTNPTVVLRLSALVILLFVPIDYVLPVHAEYAQKIPDVYIYSANFDIIRACCEVRNVDELLELDGTVDWHSSNKKWTECLIGSPASLDTFNALQPYLDQAREGFFDDQQIYVKVVNRSAGQETYIDRLGGIYTFGDPTTRKLSLAATFEMRKIINSARAAYCVKQ